MAKPSKKRRSYHHGDLRRALMDAAVALCRERGPHGFTMREAARRAGVSSGAPYKHFRDQKELMCAVAAEGMRLRAAAMDAALASASDDGVRYLKTLGDIDAQAVGWIDQVLAGMGVRKRRNA